MNSENQKIVVFQVQNQNLKPTCDVSIKRFKRLFLKVSSKLSVCKFEIFDNSAVLLFMFVCRSWYAHGMRLLETIESCGWIWGQEAFCAVKCQGSSTEWRLQMKPLHLRWHWYLWTTHMQMYPQTQDSTQSLFSRLPELWPEGK